MPGQAMKARIGLAFVLLLAGCNPQPATEPRIQETAQNISVYHDDARQVTCWIIDVNAGYGHGTGISCIPDDQLAGAISNQPLVSP